MTEHVVVIGAGLTGATAAHELQRLGHTVEVHEAEPTVGGNLRVAWLNKVPYEPHGPHILHTSDDEVWRLITSLVSINDYRHRVRTIIPDGSERTVTWPLQVNELKTLSEWPRIAGELDQLTGHPEGATFEAYALSLMGPTLYRWFCEGYTWKQWGVDPRSLSSRFAPKRLDLRTDDDPGMFRDRHQGYCPTGWDTLVQRLLVNVPVQLGSSHTLDSLPNAAGYVITAPLDQFIEGADELPWRGVRVQPRYSPPGQGTDLVAPVVNNPDHTIPWTRVVDTRRMAWSEWDIRYDQVHQVLAYEYPGASVKHYPVDDAIGENRSYHAELRRDLAQALPSAVIAGRLATYTYIDMDQAMRQGLNAAHRLHARLTGQRE